jgi:lipopolysaccharide transport system ATP-binding protein
MTLVRVRQLGKSYVSFDSETARVLKWFGIPTRASREDWIIRHLNFDIYPGESVGFVGQNGAGKSTLLKVLAGILSPTEGTVETNGRVAAIIELGMGFNQDVSGRENAIHAAELMGHSRASIATKMEFIESFVELPEYFDKPLRTYSTGMQMRVAFAVATAFEPDLLIVDEALAVGDTYFQHKCFRRIKELQQNGTSLLVVSHDKGAIQALCDRAILLENGLILRDGSPESVFDYYNALISSKEAIVEQQELANGRDATISGSGEATIEKVRMLKKDSMVEADTFEVGEEIVIEVVVRVNKDIESLVMGYALKERLGQVCFGSNTWHSDAVLENVIAGSICTFSVNLELKLGVGSYSLSIALHDRETHLTKNYEWRDLITMFNVVNNHKKHFEGLAWLEQSVDVDVSPYLEQVNA